MTADIDVQRLADEAYSFPKWLSAMMGLRNLPRATLGESCSVDQSTIGRWLNGSQLPKGRNLISLAHALGLSETDLRAATAPGNVSARREAVDQWNGYMISISEPDAWLDYWGTLPGSTKSGRMLPPVPEHVLDLAAAVGRQTVDREFMERLLASLDDEKVTVFDVLDLVTKTVSQAMTHLDPEDLSEFLAVIRDAHTKAEDANGEVPAADTVRSDEKVRALITLMRAGSPLPSVG